MREIKIGETTYGVRATTLALLFYKQEFKTSLLKDYVQASKCANEDGVLFDEITLMQIMWAMHKADKLPEKIPGFIPWLEIVGEVDFSDKELYRGILTETVEGFFRQALPKGPAPAKRTPKKK